MHNLELNHIYKVYPNGVKAVNDFSMNITDKEFIVFVGPSGCGKSTTLRMIAGLEEITSGDIKINGQIVNDAEPRERDAAMVFQNYALYPHMTVYKNMAFGLSLRHMNKEEIDRRVKEAAKILGLEEYLERKPAALSGGQRQRVALGRAMVREPKIFLLDEPLSNLDAKLRASMRNEISKLHKKLQTTFIYVTHDQVEAMTMGTRIVVMKNGYVQQIDTPRNLYSHPANKFVAGFIGTPQMNFFNVTLKKDGEEVIINFKNVDCSFKAPISLFTTVDNKYLCGDVDVVLGLRCEHISLEKDKYKYKLSAKVDGYEDLGIDSQVYCNLNKENVSLEETRFVLKALPTTKVEFDQVIDVYFDINHMHLFDKESELTINSSSPKQVTLKGKIKDNKLSILSDVSLDMPNSIINQLCDTDDIDVVIPVEAIKSGNTIEANVINYETLNGVTTTVLEHNKNFIYTTSLDEETARNNKKVKVDIDFRYISFASSNQSLDKLNDVNIIPASIKKCFAKVEHYNSKDKKVFIKQCFAEANILGKTYELSSEVGNKLVTLKDRKSFKNPVNLHLMASDVHFSNDENDYSCEIVKELDYGFNKYAVVKVKISENEQIDLIARIEDKVTNHVSLDISKAKYFDKKSGILLA